MILFGGSGHAKVIRDCIRASGGKVLLIFDDNSAITSLNETPVAGAYNPELEPKEELIIAVGDNSIRKKIAVKVRHTFGKAIHPSAQVSPYAFIDAGTVVMPMSTVNADTKVHKHCIINTGAIVEHDCLIEDFVHISPHATICGGISIGEGTHIGAGATVIPNLKIGRWCVIGAGAVVTADVPDYSLVVGVPGKVVRSLKTKD